MKKNKLLNNKLTRTLEAVRDIFLFATQQIADIISFSKKRFRNGAFRVSYEDYHCGTRK